MEDETQNGGPPTAEKGKELTPFIVARRVRTLFEATTATRSFSTGMCAKNVYQRGKSQNDKTPMGELKTVEETEDATNQGVQEEAISNLLDNLNFRFNETCELSADQSADKKASSSGESGGKSKKSSEAKNSGSKVGKGINRWRAGTKLADLTEETLSNDFLAKLQGQLQKESISTLRERLAERKMKDDTKASDGARPKGEGKKKTRKKKESTSTEVDPLDDDAERLNAFARSKLRSKLVSVQRFKERATT